MALMEQPLTIVFGGLLLAAMLIGGLIQTGKKWLLYAVVGVLVLTAGLLMLERSTITPREAVKATLHVIARDLERNDVEAIVQHISAGKTELRDEARRRLGSIEIVEVKIKRNLKVDVTSARGMDVAETSFNAVIRLKDSRYADFLNEDRPNAMFFRVWFKLEDGRWRIRKYETDDPRAGIGT